MKEIEKNYNPAGNTVSIISDVIFYAAIIFYIAWKIIGKKKPS